MTGKRPKEMTAAELLARLERDPEYQRREAARSASDRRRERELREDERGILDELRRCRVNVGSIWDLIDKGTLPTEAVTILIRHLQQTHGPPIRDGIARVLANAPAPDRERVKSALRDALSRERDESVRDAILQSIGKVAGPGDLEELVDLLLDPATGDGRLMLLLALSRFGEPGRAVLAAARSDPFLGAEATRQLRSASRARRTPGQAVGINDNELISIALDRDQLPQFLRGLATVLGAPDGVVDSLIVGIDELDPEEVTSLKLDPSDGAGVVSLEVFIDDVDAIDIVVAGPERFRAPLERLADAVMSDREG